MQSLQVSIDETDETWIKMMNSLDTEATQENFTAGLKKFMAFVKEQARKSKRQITLVTAEDLLRLTDKQLEEYIYDFLIENKTTYESSINLYFHGIKKFFSINQRSMNWEYLSNFVKGKPSESDDRPYTKEEVKSLIEYADKTQNYRLKVGILIMATTGMRIGALRTIKIRDLIPIVQCKVCVEITKDKLGNWFERATFADHLGKDHKEISADNLDIKKYIAHTTLGIVVYSDDVRHRYVTVTTPQTGKAIFEDYLASDKVLIENRLRNTKLSKLKPEQVSSPYDPKSYLISYDTAPWKRNQPIAKVTLANEVREALIKTGIRASQQLGENGRYDVHQDHGFRKLVSTTMYENGVYYEIRQGVLGHAEELEKVYSKLPNAGKALLLLNGNEEWAGYSKALQALTFSV